MATDRFGMPIITRTPFADSLRTKYGSGTPMLGNRFNVDVTNPSTGMRNDDTTPPGGTMTRATGGMWRSPSFPGGDAGRFNQPIGGGARLNDNVMRPYQPGVQPHPAPTRSPVERGRYGQDFGAMPMTGVPAGSNNLTPRFDPITQRVPDNPWGRSGNLNTGLHGLLAQLLGNRRGY